METTSDHLLFSTSGDNDAKQSEMDSNRALVMTLIRTLVPVIVLMGTVGNALSFCVLVRRRMRSTPMYFYLTLLAVADTFVLYVSAFKVWIRALTQFEVLHVSNVGCKLIMFILLCSFYMSAWLVVLVTLDRFLVIWFPFRGYLLMRIRQARLTAAVLAVVVVVYNVHIFWTIGLHRLGSSPTCVADEDNFFMTHVFEYLKLISYCVVPFFIVIGLNVGILVRINRVYTNAAMRRDCGLREEAAMYRHQPPSVVLGPPSSSSAGRVDDRAGVRPQRQHLSLSPANSTSPASRQSSLNVQKLRQRRLTRMLLFISFAWLALTAPFTLHSFLPEPPSSPSQSSSSTASLSNSPTPVTSPTLDHLMKSFEADNSTLDGSLNQDNREIQYSMFASLLDSNTLRTTTKQSFLPEDRDIVTLYTPVSTLSPSTDIDPSHFLLVKTVCFLLMYVNHAVNFYLYCLTGKRFRKELAAMLACGGCAAETVAAAAAAAPGGVGREMRMLGGRHDIHAPHRHPGRLPLNEVPSSSTSSRTHSGRMMMMLNANPMQRSSSQLNDDRYS